MKSVEQQEILTLHRFREGLMKSRIALGNQIRGVLAEFGIVFPQDDCNHTFGLKRRVVDPSPGLDGIR